MKFRQLALPLTLVAAFAASSTAFAQDIQTRTIRFGHLTPVGHPISDGVRRFAELVSQKSGGKLVVKEFAASVLGGELQQQAAVQGGVQEMFTPATTTAAALVKEFGILDAPFSITNAQQADALLQGRFGKALLDRLPEKGIVGLDYWETGFRNFTNSRKPILAADDVKGLKIRVMANPVFVESFGALGTNPVPMAFGELYGALESKALDAQENPYTIILSNKFYEVQKFVSVTNHVYTANLIEVSKKFWDKLSATEQKILQDSAREAGVYQRKVSRDSAQQSRTELEAKGMKVNEVPAAELAKMRQSTVPVIDKFAATYDPALMKIYREEMDKIHANR